MAEEDFVQQKGPIPIVPTPTPTGLGFVREDESIQPVGANYQDKVQCTGLPTPTPTPKGLGFVRGDESIQPLGAKILDKVQCTETKIGNEEKCTRRRNFNQKQAFLLGKNQKTLLVSKMNPNGEKENKFHIKVSHLQKNQNIGNDPIQKIPQKNDYAHTSFETFNSPGKKIKTKHSHDKNHTSSPTINFLPHSETNLQTQIHSTIVESCSTHSTIVASSSYCPIISRRELQDHIKPVGKFQSYPDGIVNPSFCGMTLWELSPDHIFNDFKICQFHQIKSGLILYGDKAYVFTPIENNDIKSHLKILFRNKKLKHDMSHAKASKVLVDYIRKESANLIIPFVKTIQQNLYDMLGISETMYVTDESTYLTMLHRVYLLLFMFRYDMPIQRKSPQIGRAHV